MLLLLSFGAQPTLFSNDIPRVFPAKDRSLTWFSFSLVLCLPWPWHSTGRDLSSSTICSPTHSSLWCLLFATASLLPPPPRLECFSLRSASPRDDSSECCSCQLEHWSWCCENMIHSSKWIVARRDSICFIARFLFWHVDSRCIVDEKTPIKTKSEISHFRMRWSLSRFAVSSLAAAAEDIAPGSNVFVHTAMMAPTALLDQLVGQRSRFSPRLNLYHLHTDGSANYLHFPDQFHSTAFFCAANDRAAVNDGTASFVPIFLSEVGTVCASAQFFF